MITSDQLKDVLDRADKLKHYLKIDEKRLNSRRKTSVRRPQTSGKTRSEPKSR